MHEPIDVLLGDAQRGSKIFLNRSGVRAMFAPVPDSMLYRQGLFCRVLARRAREIPAPGPLPGPRRSPIPRSAEIRLA